MCWVKYWSVPELDETTVWLEGWTVMCIRLGRKWQPTTITKQGKRASRRRIASSLNLTLAADKPLINGFDRKHGAGNN